MFFDPRFATSQITHARLTVGWDALSSPWQTEEIDTWMAAARGAGVDPLVSFGHSRTDRRSLPTPERFLFEFRRFRARYPWVKEYAAWNEANHCGEPTCHRPRLVAAYYRNMRRECPDCRILAAEVLDMPNMVSWVRAFRRARRRGAAVLGAAQLHRREPRADDRHAADAPRGQGPGVVHRDRRHRLAREPPQGHVPGVGEARGDRDALPLRQARPAEPPGHARLHLPLERGRAVGDLGLRADRPDGAHAAGLQGRRGRAAEAGATPGRARRARAVARVGAGAGSASGGRAARLRRPEVLLAVISDTHMPRGARRLPDACVERLRSADLILHAGDFVTVGVLEEIEAIGPPVAGVYGNVDEPEMVMRLPGARVVEAEGARIAVVHDAGAAAGRLERMRRRFRDADAVVFGHSHIPLHEQDFDGGFQIFNPGSPTERRRSPRHTMGMCRAERGELRFDLVDLGA